MYIQPPKLEVSFQNPGLLSSGGGFCEACGVGGIGRMSRITPSWGHRLFHNSLSPWILGCWVENSIPNIRPCFPSSPNFTIFREFRFSDLFFIFGWGVENGIRINDQDRWWRHDTTSWQRRLQPWTMLQRPRKDPNRCAPPDSVSPHPMTQLVEIYGCFQEIGVSQNGW